MSDAPRPRWLIVVQRERRKLYENLRESVAGNSRVEIVLDRRSAESTGAAVSGPAVSRRTPLASEQGASWNELGFFLIYRGDELTVYEAPPIV